MSFWTNPIWFGLATATLLLVALPARAGLIDRVAAVVDDEVIAWSEIYELGGPFIEQRCATHADPPACRREAELEVLDSLIDRVLIGHELDRLGIDVGEAEVDRAIDQVVQDNRLGSQAQLRALVEQEGSSWEGYRQQIAEQLREMQFHQQVLRPRVSVSENELRDKYRRTARDQDDAVVVLEALALEVDPGDEEARADVEAQAQDLAAGLNAGEADWDEALQAHGSGPFAGPDGKMGTFERGELMPVLEAQVAGTEVGQVTDPIALDSAVLLVRVAERRRGEVASFEEAEEELRQRLLTQKMERETEQWLQQARRQAVVRILLEEG